MKQIRVLGLALLWLGLMSCNEVHVTERSQLNLIPQDQITSSSSERYQQFLKKNEVMEGTLEAQQLQTAA